MSVDGDGDGMQGKKPDQAKRFRSLGGVVGGVLIAVIAGVIVLSIQQSQERAEKAAERVAEIRQIGELVAELRRQFEDPQPAKGNPPGVPVDLMRRAVFVGMRAKIERAVDENGRHLNFQEKSAIRGVFGDVDIHAQAGDDLIDAYDEAIRRLEELEWLELGDSD